MTAILTLWLSVLKIFLISEKMQVRTIFIVSGVASSLVK